MGSLRYSLTNVACVIALLASLPVAHAQQTAPAIDEASAQIDELITGNTDAKIAEDLIQKGLDSDKDAVRWRAARAAGHLGLSSPATVAKLQKGVADKNWIVQLHSIAALEETGDKSPATVKALLEAVGSPNERVAAAAITSLRELQIAPEKMASLLNSELAEENNGAVAIHAVEALVEAGGKATPLLKEALKQPNAGYWASVAIVDIGPDAAGTVPELTEYIKTAEHADVVPQALMAVAAIGPQAKAAESAVAGALEKWSGDQSVLLSGLYALGAIDASDSRDTIEMNAESSDKFVSMVASWALAKTTPGDDAVMKQAIIRLVAGLRSDNIHMSRAAAHGLATLKIPAGMAAPYLLEAAADPDAREHMVAAMASLGDEAIPHVSKGLAKPETRELALEVLQRMGSEAAGATDALAATIEDADASAKVTINGILARIGPAAAKATDKLLDELKSDDERVRQSAMYALREIGKGAAAAKADLLGHLKKSTAEEKKSQFERLAAAWTLARISSDDPQVVAVILPVIDEGLSSKSEIERLESITAVVDLGPAGQKLRQHVAELAKSDPNADVRNLAIVVVSEN